MDERSLLLLGLLKTQSQHGYQINDFIERNLGFVTDMKKSTAYTILDRLSAAGYVDMSSEQEGNRPPRKVYSITPTGDAKFYELLRDNLAQADALLSAGDIGLMFLDNLPKDDVMQQLTTRLTKVKTKLEEISIQHHHTFGIGVNLAIGHHLAMIQAEHDWLIKTMTHLQETDELKN